MLHELADLILSQPLLGTTVKTDGIESDPYAYLSVLNMHVHQVRWSKPIYPNFDYPLTLRCSCSCRERRIIHQ